MSILLQCAKCGKDLTEEEVKLHIEKNRPPSCKLHVLNVQLEAFNNLPWWPDGWFGHASMDTDGRWYELPSDDGDYDRVEESTD